MLSGGWVRISMTRLNGDGGLGRGLELVGMNDALTARVSNGCIARKSGHGQASTKNRER